ncbi:MAG TPA: tetratricopeptide repeat protein [Candidatus Sulfotelmatobacter sp.]|jgi:tetratricopeptide (TPR) repeat protein|nr:tetratricopeptide repeat protein [Candidatus Sulfotelmatobacter sp.]
MFLSLFHFVTTGTLRVRPIRYAACVFFIVIPAWAGAPQTTSTSPPPGAPTVRSAATALAEGDFKRAESELSKILQSEPNDVRALNLLGILRAQQQRNTDAEDLFKKAISIEPDFAAARAGLGLLYVQMGKDDLAVPELQQALKLDPGRRDAEGALIAIWRAQAHGAAQSGDAEKALSLLIAARKLDPGNPDVQFDFGMIALRMSLFPDAVDAFNQTLKLHPDDAQALYGLGRAKISLSKFDDAQQSFERYLQLRPDDASGHYALGFTLQALQRMPEARAEYEKSIELQAAQTESYFQLGLMELDAGNLRVAEAQFERVLRRAPQHAGALTGEGHIRFEQKDYAEAEQFLTKAIAANGRLREPHYYLGLTEARLGRKEDSEKELAIASQIEHEEVEKHQNVLRIIDSSQLQVPQ